jgi:2-methylcitrate dehydratase PrpD
MLTESLAKFVVETGFEDIPGEAVESAKQHVLDCLGVMLAGSRQDIGRLIIRLVEKMVSLPEAHVVGGGFRTSAPMAALANGTMGHALDFDDDSDTSFSHPTTTLLPSVMALGGSSTSGKEILTAYILGEEVSARVAQIPGLLPDHYERGWHATATLGIIGAAAAAAKILKLDTRAFRYALGIASSEAGGVQANFGSMTKPYHAGSTASKAVWSALLADAGITANPSALESPFGFIDLFGGDRNKDLSVVTDGLGENWDFISPGVNIKQYPCCYYTHTAIDLLLDMMKDNHIQVEEIQTIDCGISPLAEKILHRQAPDSGLAGKFHLPYCLAIAARYGKVTIPHFADNYLEQPEIRQFMDRIRIAAVPGFGEDRLGFNTRLAVTTQSHGTLTVAKERPKGSGSSPISWSELIVKFSSCVEGILDRKAAAFVEDAVRQMEQLESLKDVMSVVCHCKESVENEENTI